MPADTQLYLIFDRLARVRHNAETAASGGTRFWELVDEANDEVFENRVKGQSATDLDNALTAASIGGLQQVRSFLGAITGYFVASPTGAEPGLGLAVDPWNSWLSQYRRRVSQQFADTFFEATGSRIAPHWIFARGVWSSNIGDNSTARLHRFGTMTRGASAWSYTPYDGLPATMQGVPVILVSPGGVTGNVTVTLSLVNQQNQEKQVTLSSQAFPANQQVLVGAQALSGNANAGQRDIPVASTAAFTAGDYALLVDNTGRQELVLVESIVANTKLVAAQDILNSFTTANSAAAWPLFRHLTAISNASGGASGESIQAYARPDRSISL